MKLTAGENHGVPIQSLDTSKKHNTTVEKIYFGNARCKASQIGIIIYENILELPKKCIKQDDKAPVSIMIGRGILKKKIFKILL